eukprot:RCo021194
MATAALPMECPAVIEELDPRSGLVLSRYTRGPLLGKGGFARCYQVTECGSGRVYAAKVVDKTTLVRPKTAAKLRSEIQIHRSLNHPRIVRFERFFEDRDFAYILLELCGRQTLMELQRRLKRLTEPEAAFFLLQTVQGVRYMHSRSVIHRDIKLGNLFLTDALEVKIGDFGLAAQLEFDGERKLTVCGTPNYIAPEILDGGPYGHSFEVDVWSLGVVLYTMLVGRPPFETNDVQTTYHRIRSLTYGFPSGVDVSPGARRLIQRILQARPEHRPTLAQIEADPWLQQCRP